MLEEAHNLFSTDRYKDDLDVWVKLAKEASKLQLGMTYATQEVSGSPIRSRPTPRTGSSRT